MKTGNMTGNVNRREVVIAIGGVAATGVALAAWPAMADASAVEEAIKALIGDRATREGRITLDLPQIAENGNTVPLTVAVDSPMTEAEHVTRVHLFAEQNPRPDVASFNFTSRSGEARASTRMRLLKSQKIVAVAEMSDGSVYMTKTEVMVTIGGCGG